MEKIKRLINLHVPVTTCNLRCSYCYITNQSLWNNELPQFKYDAEYIGRAFSLDRLGGACLFNICGGGETLLPPNIPQVIYHILKEGHFIELVTNGTLSKRFDEIACFPASFLERLEIKFSFHYLELCRTKRLETFFCNVNKMRAAGCSITIELTASDVYIEHIEDIKSVCIKNVGAYCQATIPRDDTKPEKPLMSKYNLGQFKEIWKELDSTMLDFKASIFNVKRKEFCYAGAWHLYVNMGTGEAKQCYQSDFNQNIFQNIDKPIKFIPIGKHCREPHCYNGHALLTLGLIPELKTPTYATIRNRVCADGTEWLTPRFKVFISNKLKENNKTYSLERKIILEILRPFRMPFKKNTRLLQRIKKSIHWRLKKVKHRLYAHKKLLVAKRERNRIKGSAIWIIGTPEHANIGDQAIIISMRKFLGEFCPNKEVVEITANHFRKCSRPISALVKHDDVIVVPGGGWLGDLWLHDETMVRDIIQSFPHNKIVIFPQTVSWSDEDSKVEIERTKLIYQNHHDLHMCLRDASSFEFVKSNYAGGNFTDCIYAPDIVCYLDRTEPRLQRNEILLCFRDDREKILNENKIKEIERQITQCDHSFKHINTAFHGKLTKSERSRAVESKFNEIKQAKLLITDRLHGMLFAAITATPCIAFDNATQKVSGVYEWLKHLDYIYFADFNEDIEVHINKMLLCDFKEYSTTIEMTSGFKQIAKVINMPASS
jgi:exopolysaccharide biosynthesis predicted pyruvyltransferase EpsI/organic radical activating enzyme